MNIYSKKHSPAREKLRAFVKKVEIVLLCVIIAVALFFVGREIYALIRVNTLPQQETDYIAEQASSPTYWRNVVRSEAVDMPNMSAAMEAALAAASEDESFIADFSFYDSNVTAAVEYEGDTLLTLYQKHFELGVRNADINAVTESGIAKYYENYVRPYLPREREEDFTSAYGSIYEAALAAAQEEPELQATVEDNPEVFSSRAAFDEWLFSEQFLSYFPEVYELILTDGYVNDPESDMTKAERAEVRERYEELVFGYIVHTGRKAEEDLRYTSAQTAEFEEKREKLGELYFRAQDDRLRVLGIPDPLCDRDSYGDVSLYNAVLTKKQIIDLAGEGRFYFFGVGLARTPENGLANAAGDAYAQMTSEAESVSVYRLGEHYYKYYNNYWAPYTLPGGFAEQLKEETEGLAATNFDYLVGYDYHDRWAQVFTGTPYQVARRIALHPGSFFTTTDFKPFTYVKGGM